MTPGQRFRAALSAEKPLQIAGAINAYAALLAQRAGFRALYLSGAGVANHSCGWPDTGRTELADVLIDARRIARRVDLPLLVDIDTDTVPELETGLDSKVDVVDAEIVEGPSSEAPSVPGRNSAPRRPPTGVKL